MTCPNGPRGGMRPDPSDDAIMFGPKAQKKGQGIFGPYISPPLIRARFLGTNQRTQETESLAEKSNR